MTAENSLTVVIYTSKSSAAEALERELSELEVAYARVSLQDAPEEVRRASSGDIDPIVSVNGELLLDPSASNLMSAIMHARSGGFYQ